MKESNNTTPPKGFNSLVTESKDTERMVILDKECKNLT
jgi:hypothetical protein